MQKTIYVDSKETWDRIRQNAEKRGLSVSKYLVACASEDNRFFNPQPKAKNADQT